MSDSRKKVILRRQQAPPLFGYLPSAGFVHNGAVGLLDLEGRTLAVPLPEIQTIFFVRDFNRADRFNPERLTRRTFTSRPRGEGLWLRLTLRDSLDLRDAAAPPTAVPGALQSNPALLEGLAPLDLSLLDSLLQDGGLSLIPPDTRANTLRLFVPRTSIVDLRVLAVIGGPRQRPSPAPSPTPADPAPGQRSLFEPPAAADPHPPLRRRLTS